MDSFKKDKGIILISIILGIISLVTIYIDVGVLIKSSDVHMRKDIIEKDEGFYSDNSLFFIMINKERFRISKGVYEDIPESMTGYVYFSGLSNYIYKIDSNDVSYRSLDVRLLTSSIFLFVLLLYFYINGSIFSGWGLAAVSLYWFSSLFSILFFN